MPVPAYTPYLHTIPAPPAPPPQPAPAPEPVAPERAATAKKGQD